MSEPVRDSSFVVLAYLIGSIPFGVLIGKLKGVDPREVGSKNIGATNVMRALGPGFGLLVLALDMLKGYVPVALALRAYALPPMEGPVWGLTGNGDYVVFLTAVAAMLGHLFPVFLGFKGGKGVATAGGIIFGLDPRVGLIALATFIIVLAVTRYVSVSSTAAAIAIPLSAWWLTTRIDRDMVRFRPDIAVLFGTLAAVFVIVKHRSNYKRLMNGTEPKFGAKKK